MRRLRAYAQETPLFCVWPTDARRHIRAAGTRLHHLNLLRLGPQTVVDGQYRKRRRCPKGWRARNRQSQPCLCHCRNLQDVGRATQPKPDVVVTVVRVVVVAVGRVRVVLIVVPGTAAKHTAHRHREPHWLIPASSTIGQIFLNPKKKITRKGASRPFFAADAATSDQRFKRWGTCNTTETRGSGSGRSGST